VLRDVELLISLVAEHEMVMLLLEGLPTLKSMEMRNWTWPDHIFSSSSLEDKVIYCTMDPRLRGPGTDHVPILTLLELPIKKVDSVPVYDWWG